MYTFVRLARHQYLLRDQPGRRARQRPVRHCVRRHPQGERTRGGHQSDRQAALPDEAGVAAEERGVHPAEPAAPGGGEPRGHVRDVRAGAHASSASRLSHPGPSTSHPVTLFSLRCSPPLTDTIIGEIDRTYLLVTPRSWLPLTRRRSGSSRPGRDHGAHSEASDTVN